ncbi:MAG TPA: glycosyl hydrolase, partial [Haliscomenobacter sp.]|uniref:glycosyl hydrolase n=1 Tax=Haliscomenobacter sp. TaxID=2717303 RepID=UPI002CD97FD4
MQHSVYVFSLFIFLCFSMSGQSTVSDPDLTFLQKNFLNPPQRYGIRCWWWWLNGNVTKAAISRDLAEMKAKGF